MTVFTCDLDLGLKTMIWTPISKSVPQIFAPCVAFIWEKGVIFLCFDGEMTNISFKLVQAGISLTL